MGIAGQGQVGQIDEDIPCVSCRYNLRGLQRDGKCPECGTLISPSIEAYQLLKLGPASPIADSDPRWLRNIAEGMTIILIALFLILLMSLAPEWAYTAYSPQRRIMRGIGCTIWVLCWHGVWKLTSPELEKDRAFKKQGRILRLVLRSCATLYATTPFFELSSFSESVAFPVALAVLLLGLIASACYYAFLCGMARRADVSGVEAFAMLLVVINPFVFYVAFMMSSRYSDYDGLSKIVEIPTTPFGSPIPILQEVGLWWSNLGRHGFESLTWLIIVEISLLISQGIAHIVLSIRLWRALGVSQKKFKEGHVAAHQSSLIP